MSKQRATFSRFSSEFDGIREYYLDDGTEVPLETIRDNTATNKPGYDIEVGGKPWSFNFTFDIYYGINKRIAHYKLPVYSLGWLLAVLVCLVHKLTARLGRIGRQR